MPKPKHNLPTQFSRLDDQITGPVLDSIVIDPRSHGRLHMPRRVQRAKRRLLPWS